MLTLEQFKEYVHFFDEVSVENEIISSFSENDHICDMTENKESTTLFKVNADNIEYFTFDSAFFHFPQHLLHHPF